MNMPRACRKSMSEPSLVEAFDFVIVNAELYMKILMPSRKLKFNLDSVMFLQ